MGDYTSEIIELYFLFMAFFTATLIEPKRYYVHCPRDAGNILFVTTVACMNNSSIYQLSPPYWWNYDNSEVVCFALPEILNKDLALRIPEWPSSQKVTFIVMSNYPPEKYPLMLPILRVFEFKVVNLKDKPLEEIRMDIIKCLTKKSRLQKPVPQYYSKTYIIRDKSYGKKWIDMLDSYHLNADPHKWCHYEEQKLVYIDINQENYIQYCYKLEEWITNPHFRTRKISCLQFTMVIFIPNNIPLGYKTLRTLIKKYNITIFDWDSQEIYPPSLKGFIKHI